MYDQMKLARVSARVQRSSCISGLLQTCVRRMKIIFISEQRLLNLFSSELTQVLVEPQHCK